MVALVALSKQSTLQRNTDLFGCGKPLFARDVILIHKGSDVHLLLIGPLANDRLL